MKKRRLLSILLIAMLIVTLIPVVNFGNDNKAYAAADWENQIYIGDTPVNMENLTGDGWDFKNGGGGKYILELKDDFNCINSAKLSDSNDEAVIQIRSLQNVTIKLLGNATVGTAGSENNAPNGTNTYGIYAPETNLAIEGNGTLNVNSNANAIWCKDLRVEGPTLNCNAYRTAIRVIDSSASIDKAATRGNMLVKSGANVTAKTTNGRGLYPETFVLGGYGADYRDNGGAAILVSGSLTVENSTVNAENSCNELPTVTSGFKNKLDKSDVFYGNSFCTTIFVWNDLTVSGNDASVTGKLKNTTSGYIDTSKSFSFKLGAVVANKMYVKEGGTLEGFITTTYHSEFAQGLRRFCRNNNDDLVLKNALISRSGEGTVRAGIVNTDVAVESPEYADSPYYATEDFSPTEKYGNHLEITIGKVSTVYLRTTDSGPELSFQSDFGRVYSLDSTTIDLRDLSNSVFAQNGYMPEWGFPKIYVKSGDWTIIPPCETEADYYIKGGSLTIRPQDGMEYAGGRSQIEIGATLNIDGDGIAKNWDVSACLGTDRGGGTLRFVSGTVENASASIGISVCIIGGNINFNPIPMMQNVKNGDGTKLYKDVYLMGPKADELVLINTGEGTITPESSYYYPIGYDKALVVWTINDLPIKYVTVTPEDGESYNLISGGVIESLGSEYHRLVRAERYKEFVPNPNYRFYRNPDESVTLNAAGSINTYENRLDSAFYGPYLIDSTTDLGSSLRAEWSYQNDNGEKVVVGGNSLTCTIEDLSDIVNYRTYTCTVYETAADGSEKAIGSYNANVYVMRWEQPDTIYAAIDQEVTFTVNPSEETEWAAGFLSTFKWQVNKGAGWEDIPDSQTDSYTVTITEENAGYKYRRVINGFQIGNFDKHESNIYVEMNSPELSVTLAPEIISQPQSIKIQENDTAKHKLSVGVNNAQSYQWQRKADDKFVDIEGADSSTLEVGVEDVGTYRCVVSNAYGETVSEEANVTMYPAPVCGILKGVTAMLGAKAEFAVGISNAPGDGSVSVKWQYSVDDGETWVDVVSTDDRDNISMNVLEMVFSQIWSDGTVIRRSEISSSSMTIGKTTADMDGWKVRCVLTDRVGVYYSDIVELSIDMPKYTVSFDTGGHGTVPTPITEVKYGSTISAPSMSVTGCYKFGGWYTDKACSEDSEFDFSTPIMQDTTLYAKWTATCKDENPKDHKCDNCGADIGTHEDKDKDHNCDYGCAETIGDHRDEDKDHNCDYGCAVKIGTHKATDESNICGYCGKEVTNGEEFESPDHNLEKTPAKAATVTETGHKEYWYCPDCGKYFSDVIGTKEITDLDAWKSGEGRIDKLPPEIIEGKGQSITAGEKKALSFTSNANYNDFLEVQLDGKILEEKNYTRKEGSIVVTLNADYVATLPAGEHTIGIVSKSGTATTTFVIEEKAAPVDPDDNNKGNSSNKDNDSKTDTEDVMAPEDSSKTGDSTSLAPWIALMFLAGAGITGAGFYSRRKRTNE